MILRIKQLRTDMGITQTELAKISGYTQSQVWRWENEKELPGAKAITDLVVALHVEPNDLFEGEWR
jgi:transcriptional regulator with XRE-family HTH domain